MSGRTRVAPGRRRRAAAAAAARLAVGHPPRPGPAAPPTRSWIVQPVRDRATGARSMPDTNMAKFSFVVPCGPPSHTREPTQERRLCAETRVETPAPPPTSIKLDTVYAWSTRHTTAHTSWVVTDRHSPIESCMCMPGRAQPPTPDRPSELLVFTALVLLVLRLARPRLGAAGWRERQDLLTEHHPMLPKAKRPRRCCRKVQIYPMAGQGPLPKLHLETRARCRSCEELRCVRPKWQRRPGLRGASSRCHHCEE